MTISSFIERAKRYLEILRNLNLNTAELKNITEARSNETFKNHLELIGKGTSITPLELTYSFSYAIRTLKPQITQHNSIKDTVLCTVAFGDAYLKAVKPCLDSHDYYCGIRGYDCARLTLPPSRMHRHPSWYKIPLVGKLLRLGYKHVFFIDADAMITNPAISLQAFFDRLAESKKIIHVAEDDDGINMGLFFINNHPDAIRLLDLLWIYNLGSHRVLWEQAAFRDLLDNYSQIRNILSLAESPKEFNSFPKERQAICGTNQTNNWSEGDFVCHFSGLKSPDLEKMIAHYVSTYSIKLTL